MNGKKYIIAWIVIYTFSMYMMSLMTYKDKSAMFTEMIGSIVVAVIGISVS